MECVLRIHVSMRILIQQTVTRLYWHMLNEWTAQQKAAFDFQSFKRAVSFVCEHQLANVQIVLVSPESRWRRAIPFSLLAPSSDKMRNLTGVRQESVPELSRRRGDGY